MPSARLQTVFPTSRSEEINRKFDTEQECGDQNGQRCREHDSCPPISGRNVR
jgi:hypothetical protein